MSEWKRVLASSDTLFDLPHCYKRDETGIAAIVYLRDELWVGVVYVGNDLVDRGEWSCREAALGNAVHAMKRACRLRRFLPNPPTISKSVSEREDDDDDDD